jgi:hypothetical protein
MGDTYINFGIRNAALYRLMFSAAQSGPDWRPEQVLEAGRANRALFEKVLRRAARSGEFGSALPGRIDVKAAALHAWGNIHGLTMLAIDGLASVEEVTSESFERRGMETFVRNWLSTSGESAKRTNKSKSRTLKVGR